MRRLATLAALALTQCVTTSVEAPFAPIRPAAFDIAATPVALDGANPARTRLGALTWLGAWQLQGRARGFGGLSSLSVAGDRFTALSDAGAIVRFRLGRFGHASGATIVAVPRACASGDAKTDRDTESLATDGGRWWIGFEWTNSICRTLGDLLRAERVVRPPRMARWPRTAGPESILRLSDGRFLVIAEGARNGGAIRPVLLFDRDPVDPASQVIQLAYRPPSGFDPTDAAQLPDGRILVLNRRFTPWSLFTARLVLLDRSDFGPGAVLKGREIAAFAAPVVTDNYEGIAVTVEGGRTVVWIVSDDNFMPWERTLLLKFALN